MKTNHYTSLGVSRQASQDEIKAAFRKFAVMYHPDKSGADPEKFRLVSEAYEILGDIEKRKAYDLAQSRSLVSNIQRSAKAIVEEYFQQFKLKPTTP